MASALFAGLRQLDAGGLDVIACPLPPAEGLGLALRDRLEKAARPAPDGRATPPKVD
jgi:L-threonylcarbamoyladenylate synthase